jgi:hypothetical protein
MHSSAHRVSLVPPQAGRTAFLRQAGRPSRSITSTTPCASQYKLVCGVQSARCEARTALISPRADSTPPHFSAPGTGAQTATLRLVMEPAEKGQVPRQGYASRPSVSLLTPYGPRRFKGPFGSPLFAPTLTLRRPLRARAPTGSDAFVAAPYCGGSYLTPAKWQMCGGSCSQKHSHTRPNRRGRLVPPTAGSATRVAVSTNASPVRPFQAPRTRLRLEAAFGGLVLAGRKGRASHRQRSGLKIPPRPLAATA